MTEILIEGRRYMTLTIKGETYYLSGLEDNQPRRADHGEEEEAHPEGDPGDDSQ